LETFVSAAKALLESGMASERIGNIGSPLNPRRLQLVVEKYSAAVDASKKQDED
jgi:hypothetical protein